MTIYDDLRRDFNFRRHEGEIGLEIETEAKESYEYPLLSFWTVHEDGSLRGPGPAEYVLKVPLEYSIIPESLIEFKEKTDHIDFTHDSITTSVHVHLNMLNETWITLGNFLTIYALVENLLTRFAGNSRYSNCFCLPLCDAEENYHNILRLFEGVDKRHFHKFHFDEDNCKYAALNISCLTRLGSVEQRSLRGTTDIEVIQLWVDLLYAILVYSRQDITPVDIILRWKEQGLALLTDIWGENVLVLQRDDELFLVERNVWYATNIATCIPDWKALDKAPGEIPQITNDEYDKYSMYMYGRVFNDLRPVDQIQVLQHFNEAVVKVNPLPLEWREELVNPLAGVRNQVIGNFEPFQPQIDPNQFIGGGGGIDPLPRAAPRQRRRREGDA